MKKFFLQTLNDHFCYRSTFADFLSFLTSRFFPVPYTWHFWFLKFTCKNRVSKTCFFQKIFARLSQIEIIFAYSCKCTFFLLSGKSACPNDFFSSFFPVTHNVTQRPDYIILDELTQKYPFNIVSHTRN